MTVRVLACGDEAVLVEVEDLDAVLGLHAALAAEPPEGVAELVPAARTIFVAFDPERTDAGRLEEALAAVRPAEAARESGPVVEIPVTYDGEDLEEAAQLAGMSVEELVRRHTAGDYVAAFCGFAPGFAYLDGLEPALHLPRRDSPRTRVPAGSVAVADRYAGVYPRESPGGWRLLGRTDAVLWDTDRDPPALLAPGTRVRFTEAR